VQILEEKGIGRPSTFSSIVDKIQERKYVKKEDVVGVELECKDYTLENDEIIETETKRSFGNEKGKLVIQQLGILVIEFLNDKFQNLFEYNYTRQMETDLDNISTGDKIWYELCKTCDCEIEQLIKINGKNKLEIKIDDNSSYIIGKYGPVLKCNETIDNKDIVVFKPVKKNIDIHKLNNGEYLLNDVIDNEKIKLKERVANEIILGKYDNHDVILRKGKFGLYITWGSNSKALKELGNRPIESITFNEIEKYLSEGSNVIRNISENITIRKGPKGDYIFFKTSKMKTPKFYTLKNCILDYNTCELFELKTWINDVHSIK
jgi:DNA topoisomerase-1